MSNFTASSSPSVSSSSNSGLVPGYKHVESFGPPEDYSEDEEEEEFYVTLDLGTVDQTLVPSSSSYRLIGLDTPTPFLQIAGTIMKGHYKTLIGTELIFKDVSGEAPPEEETSTGAETDFNLLKPKRTARYFTKTDKRILFHEVTLKPKSEGSGPSGGAGQFKFIHSGVSEGFGAVAADVASGPGRPSSVYTFGSENPPSVSGSGSGAAATDQAAENSESMRIEVDADADVIDPSSRGDNLESISGLPQEVEEEEEEESMDVDT